MASPIENEKVNVTPDRFFPVEIEPGQLMLSFRLFLEITLSFSGFGTNVHYSFERNAINMKFDLLNGGSLGLYVNKELNETFIVIHREAVVHTEQIGEIVDMKFGPDKKTLFFTSSNGTIHTVDQLGRVTSDFSNMNSEPLPILLADIVKSMGEARRREEQQAVTKPYDPTRPVKRNIPLEVVGWMFDNATVVGTNSLDTVLRSEPFNSTQFETLAEEKTKPISTEVDEVTEESTAMVPVSTETSVPSPFVSEDNSVRFRNGEPVPAQAKITGGWHLPAPKSVPAQSST